MFRRWKRVLKTKKRRARWDRMRHQSPLLPVPFWTNIKMYIEKRYPANPNKKEW